jgi:palmitoyltransferase
MIISLMRLLYVTTFHPPYIPLGPAAIEAREAKRKISSEEDSVGMGAYATEKGREDPDSPGLELFYTKDVFITETDGRPIWCSHCANWKPDRTHHDSTSGRCIAKMDHFCPWVGGPIGENNFKYFIQYTFWTALYCLHLLVVMAVYIRRQAISPVSFGAYHGV